MWAHLYNFLTSFNGTAAEPLCGTIINIIDPINRFAYSAGLTDCRSLSQLTVDDFLTD